MKDTHIAVWIGKSGTTIVIRPEGACTAAICETVSAGLRAHLDEVILDVTFDLSSVPWVDSTFTGFLVSLVRGGRIGGRRVHLFQPTETASNSLTKMHVLGYFDIQQESSVAPAEWVLLPPVEVDGPQMADQVVTSHEQLIEADGRNEREFAPVVKLFRAHREKS